MTRFWAGTWENEEGAAAIQPFDTPLTVINSGGLSIVPGVILPSQDERRGLILEEEEDNKSTSLFDCSEAGQI